MTRYHYPDDVDDREGVTPTPCPYCGANLDAATAADLGPSRPVAGDLTVCAYCAGFLVYAASGAVRLPTDVELVELANVPELARARSMVLAIIAARS